MSFLSNPPSRVKNFSPLRLNGKWLAVIITPPVTGSSRSTVDMNMAGVEARPQSRTSAPARVAPSMKAAFSAGPDRRESIPTATVTGRSTARSYNHLTKAAAIIAVTSAVRFTCSPAMPSRATPRISDPFCSFLHSIIVFSFPSFRCCLSVFIVRALQCPAPPMASHSSVSDE